MLGPPPLPRNLEAAVRDLGSVRPEVRVSAIEDLVRHADRNDFVRTRAVPLIAERLKDAHPRVRSSAAVALADLSAEEALPALLVAVEDEDGHVREMALSALGEIGDTRALPRLRRALSDDRPEVRYQAVIAFSRVAKDDHDVDGALVEAANDDDAAIVHIALRVAEERIDEGKKPDGRLVRRAKELLDAERSEVAVVAAIFLAKAGDASGHDVVLRVVRGAFATGKEDERAAVELAGALDLRAAVPDLERRAFGIVRHVKDTCSFHAKIALARMGHARAKSEILGDLDSARREVREAAVVAAGRARLREAKPAIERFPEAACDADLVREALALLAEEREDADEREGA
jgi:hypothetical protein